ncbi:MAG: type II toxin-antitoxin system death-on-curing family toxin [Gemmatimonadota bacterium]|nr:type II toxin-antitoxin system death-on-curing family toxin [Gemmatimonadota bacterium]
MTRLILETIHSELLSEHGGAPGVRAGGDNLIESALARPQHRFAYGSGSDLADVASAYLYGLVKNHGYIDGNKRVAFAAAATFLLLNRARLTASEPEAYDMVIAVVDGRQTEKQAAVWIRTHMIFVH